MTLNPELAAIVAEANAKFVANSASAEWEDKFDYALTGLLEDGNVALDFTPAEFMLCLSDAEITAQFLVHLAGLVREYGLAMGQKPW